MEHDPKCVYIKKWIPELNELDPKIIHEWYKHWDQNKDIQYVKPICDFSEQRKAALEMYSVV
jgi:deoxyribodipyrimidine photo-lyase